MPRLTCDPGKQAITPENRHTYTLFIEIGLIYSQQSKWEWVQTIFSFLGMNLQKTIEMRSYMPYILGQEFLFNNLAIRCMTEKF